MDPGSVLAGIYRIEHELTRDPVGEVHRGVYTTLGIPLAINTPRPDGSLDWERFEALTRLRHPRWPLVYEILTQGEARHVICGLVQGQTLEQVLERSGPFSEAQVLGFARDMLAALEPFHAMGLPFGPLWPHDVVQLADGHWTLLHFGRAAGRPFIRGAPAPWHEGAVPPMELQEDLYNLVQLMVYALTLHGSLVHPLGDLRPDLSRRTVVALEAVLKTESSAAVPSLRQFGYRLGLKELFTTQLIETAPPPPPPPPPPAQPAPPPRVREGPPGKTSLHRPHRLASRSLRPRRTAEWSPRPSRSIASASGWRACCRPRCPRPAWRRSAAP